MIDILQPDFLNELSTHSFELIFFQFELSNQFTSLEFNAYIKFYHTEVELFAEVMGNQFVEMVVNLKIEVLYWSSAVCAQLTFFE